MNQWNTFACLVIFIRLDSACSFEERRASQIVYAHILVFLAHLYYMCEMRSVVLAGSLD